MRKTVKAFKALSDETRLRVLSLVLQQECCVCEVMQSLEISQSRASRHLSALCDAGFLKQRRDGLWSVYSVDSESMPDLLGDVVAAVAKSFAGNSIMAQDRKRLAKAVRVGPRCVGNNGCCPTQQPVSRGTTDLRA